MMQSDCVPVNVAVCVCKMDAIHNRRRVHAQVIRVFIEPVCRKYQITSHIFMIYSSYMIYSSFFALTTYAAISKNVELGFVACCILHIAFCIPSAKGIMGWCGRCLHKDSTRRDDGISESLPSGLGPSKQEKIHFSRAVFPTTIYEFGRFQGVHFKELFYRNRRPRHLISNWLLRETAQWTLSHYNGQPVWGSLVARAERLANILA